MSQPLRPNPAGWFHVMNRGARRQEIFLDDDDRQFFVSLLSGLQRRFEVRVVSYCLMSNHYHLALRCPEPGLSSAMQWLGSRYTRRFNSKRQLDGPMCRARFHSVEITDDAQLLTVVRYIHRNPLALSSRLDLAAYDWSSHGAYVGTRETPKWLETNVPLAFFNGDRDRFGDSVETALAFDAVNNRRARLSAAKRRESKAARLPSRTEIERAVAASAAVSVTEVRRRRTGVPNDLNDCVLLLWMDVHGATAEDIAAAYGFASSPSANRAVGRARARSATDPTLGRLLERARSRLRPTHSADPGDELRPSA